VCLRECLRDGFVQTAVILNQDEIGDQSEFMECVRDQYLAEIDEFRRYDHRLCSM
jgi:hypothetical protein